MRGCELRIVELSLQFFHSEKLINFFFFFILWDLISRCEMNSEKLIIEYFNILLV